MKASIGDILIKTAAFAIIIAGMRAASTILLYIALAFLLSFLLIAPVSWLTKYRVPRPVAVLAVVAIAVGISTAAGTLLGTRLVALAGTGAQLDQIFSVQLAQLDSMVANLASQLGSAPPPTLATVVRDQLQPSSLVTFLTGLLERLGLIVTHVAIIVIMTGFLLMEVTGFRKKMRHAFGEKLGLEAWNNFEKVGDAVRRYVVLKTLISIGTGLSVSVLMFSLGSENWILWGVLAFMLNYIPNIGSFVAAAPAVLFTWLMAGLGTAIAASAGFLVINLVWGNIVEPRVMGEGVGLSAMVVFTSLVFWGWVLGPIGMLLSVPLTVMLRIVLGANDSTQWLAVILGSDKEIQLDLPPSGSSAISPAAESKAKA